MRSAAGIKHGLREAFVPLVSTNTLCKIRSEREDGIVMKAKKQTHRIGSATSKSTARSFSVQRILVPIDLSEPSKKALRYALTLARPFGAKLILLYVIEPVATHDFAYHPLMLEQNKIIAAAEERLKKLCQEEALDSSRIEKTLVR